MYRHEEYWGRPLPGFGDAGARLLIVGLAPAAHGGNRTGRMFTGDRSGDFLFRALYEAGFANQPESIRRGDGLQLRDCYITAALRCAPPQNRPAREELLKCRPYLLRELELLNRLRVVLALGHIGFQAYLDAIRERVDEKPRSGFRFAHGASFDLPGSLPKLLASYHPSQQNTQTGRLTAEMFRSVLGDVRRHLALDV
ncbi:MAG: uracil-DNA glycosylase [Terriglobia bacterium]